MVAVPPHLLRAIAQNKLVAEHISRSAQLTLEHTERVLQARVRLSTSSPHLDINMLQCQSTTTRQSIVPPHILRNIAESDASEGSRKSARNSLEHLKTIIGKVKGSQSGSQQVLEASGQDSTKPSPKSPYRAIYDIHESTNEEKLPGKLVRDNKKETDKSEDKSVNLAFDNVGVVLDFYKKH
jgi:Zn-dependent metalloprotease